MKGTLVIIAVAIVLLLPLMVYWSGKADDQQWHHDMAIEIGMRKTCVRALSSRDENVKTQAQQTLLVVDKIILGDKRLKPYWASFTDDELKALEESKSDLGSGP